MVKSEDIIEAVVASLQPNTSERDKYVLRETLRGLVRLAQAEQLTAIGEDLKVVEKIARRHTRFRKPAQ